VTDLREYIRLFDRESPAEYALQEIRVSSFAGAMRNVGRAALKQAQAMAGGRRPMAAQAALADVRFSSRIAASRPLWSHRRR
jgi:hypothetical protein